MQNSTTINQVKLKAYVNSFILNVYAWMSIGLALTGLVAYWVAGSETMLQVIFGNRIIFFGLIIAELGFVFYLSARIEKIRSTTATALFIIYASLNGATLASIFLLYTKTSIVSTFFICAATFGVCSIYGMVTKRDLTSTGNFMLMGLIGIIIASLVNVFVKSSAIAMIINYVGVLIFVGLTAYDTQKIKRMAHSQPADLDGGAIRKGAIMGALSLYLDFINMFLFLLRIIGNKE